MTSRICHLFILVLMAFSSAGCTAISALEEASQPLEVYELRTPPVTGTGNRRHVELIVEEPIASGALATERIMIRPGPLRAQYLPGVRWADPAPIMLQTLMVRSLTDAGSFGSVGRSPIHTVADFAVLSELTDFQAEMPDGANDATVRVRLTVRLVRERDARVVATRTFTETVSAASAEPSTLVTAFDVATARLLSGMVDWIRRSLGAV